MSTIPTTLSTTVPPRFRYFVYFLDFEMYIASSGPPCDSARLLIIGLHFRAAVEIRFQFPYPSHSHRKSCGNSHRIPIPTEPRNLPYLYPTPCVFSLDVGLYEMPSTLDVSFDAFIVVFFVIFDFYYHCFIVCMSVLCVCIFCVTLFSVLLLA